LDFGKEYGPDFHGLIQVHHTKPWKGRARSTDPKEDLRPLCPNCHALVHWKRGDDLRTIEEVKDILAAARESPRLA
jgi:5-methylcytosine-specific restriction protein A